MLDALHAARRECELLTYAHGEDAPVPRALKHHRLARVYGDRSLRSGPSLAKLAQDAALVGAIVRLRPSVVVAHHVEASAAACAARVVHPLKVIFVAHTALAPELPMYLPPALAPMRQLARIAGDALDRSIRFGADQTLAISPSLANRMGVPWLPVPWPIPEPVGPAERELARAQLRERLGLEVDARVLLYAGNLDTYQGLPVLSDALTRLPDTTLVVASASHFASFAWDRRARVRFLPLDGTETQRRWLHAATDAVVVPRASPGGIPIKMLDALARGVPVVACRRATAGMPGIESVASVVADDDGAAFAEGVQGVFGARTTGQRSSLVTPRGDASRQTAECRDAQRESRRRWVDEHCSASTFVHVLEAAIRRTHPTT